MTQPIEIKKEAARIYGMMDSYVTNLQNKFNTNTLPADEFLVVMSGMKAIADGREKSISKEAFAALKTDGKNHPETYINLVNAIKMDMVRAGLIYAGHEQQQNMGKFTSFTQR